MAKPKVVNTAELASRLPAVGKGGLARGTAQPAGPALAPPSMAKAYPMASTAGVRVWRPNSAIAPMGKSYPVVGPGGHIAKTPSLAHGVPEPLTPRKTGGKPCCDDCGKAASLGKPQPCGRGGGPIRSSAPARVAKTLQVGPHRFDTRRLGPAVQGHGNPHRLGKIPSSLMPPSQITPVYWTGHGAPPMNFQCFDGSAPTWRPFTAAQRACIGAIIDRVPDYWTIAMGLPCQSDLAARGMTPVCDPSSYAPGARPMRFPVSCNYREGMLRWGLWAWPQVLRDEANSAYDTGACTGLFRFGGLGIDDREAFIQTVLELGQTTASSATERPYVCDGQSSGAFKIRPVDYSLGYWSCVAPPPDYVARPTPYRPLRRPMDAGIPGPGSPPPSGVPGGPLPQLCPPLVDLRSSLVLELEAASIALQAFRSALLRGDVVATSNLRCWMAPVDMSSGRTTTTVEVIMWLDRILPVLSSPPPILYLEDVCQIFELQLESSCVPSEDGIAQDLFNVFSSGAAGLADEGCNRCYLFDASVQAQAGEWSRVSGYSFDRAFDATVRTVVFHELTHLAIPPGPPPLPDRILHGAIPALWAAIGLSAGLVGSLSLDYDLLRDEIEVLARPFSVDPGC